MKFFKFWFPVLAYSGIIFYVSSLQIGSVAADSNDKIVHLVEYSLLGYLFARALKATANSSRKTIVFSTVLFALFFGISDEFHQSFVPTRQCEAGDAAADTAGGFLGVMVFLSVLRKKRKLV